MFLSLELPGGDKKVSLMARDLAGDRGYDDRLDRAPSGSERHGVDSAVNEFNRALGQEPNLAFHGMFNQFRWEWVTGWEYWSDDYQLMLKHALLVAAELKVPLHVGISIIDPLLAAAESCGITFNYDFALPVENPNHRDFELFNAKIRRGDYLVLSDVAMP